jgi:hypothetical protein
MTEPSLVDGIVRLGADLSVARRRSGELETALSELHFTAKRYIELSAPRKNLCSGIDFRCFDALASALEAAGRALWGAE